MLRDLVRIEREIETTDGHWYLMRIVPYRTVDNVIDGVVITFLDNHEARTVREEARRLNEGLQAARDLAERIVDTVREPLLVLNEDLRVVSANHAFYHFFRVDSAETIGSSIFELGNGQWNVPTLRLVLEAVLHEDKTFERHELRHEFPEIGCRTMLLNARPMIRRGGRSKLILLAMQEAPGTGTGNAT